MSIVQREPIPGWARIFLSLVDMAIYEARGKRTIRMAWAVNVHKIFTLFIILGMMFHYQNFTAAAWVYLGLHGSYGYCWLIKDAGFRDHQFNQSLSLFGVINMYLLLIGWYWLAPWLMISRFVEPSGALLFVAIAIHTLGVVLMIAADGQRHWILKYRQQPGLITDGVYKYTRNPNYLGELMLYSAYPLLAAHWAAWVVFAYMALYFLARMKNKDHSISRHEGWQDYKRQSGLLIPWRLFSGMLPSSGAVAADNRR